AVCQLPRLRPQVARIGKVDASLPVDTEVIGRVESLTLVPVRDGLALLRRYIPPRYSAPAAVRPLAGDQVAAGIEHEPVRLEAVGYEDRGPHGVRVEPHDLARVCAERDVREVDAAVRSNGGSLGESALDRERAREDELQSCAFGHDRILRAFQRTEGE